jgi:hypothetical protein
MTHYPLKIQIKKKKKLNGPSAQAWANRRAHMGFVVKA